MFFSSSSHLPPDPGCGLRGTNARNPYNLPPKEDQGAETLLPGPDPHQALMPAQTPYSLEPEAEGVTGMGGAVLRGEAGSGVGEPLHRAEVREAHSPHIPHSQEGNFRPFGLCQSHRSWVAAVRAPSS